MDEYQPTSPGTLMTRKDIGDYASLSKQRVHQITHDPAFPRPVDLVDGGRTPVWRRSAIERHLPHPEP